MNYESWVVAGTWSYYDACSEREETSSSIAFNREFGG